MSRWISWLCRFSYGFSIAIIRPGMLFDTSFAETVLAERDNSSLASNIPALTTDVAVCTIISILSVTTSLLLKQNANSWLASVHSIRGSENLTSTYQIIGIVQVKKLLVDVFKFWNVEDFLTALSKMPDVIRWALTWMSCSTRRGCAVILEDQLGQGNI